MKLRRNHVSEPGRITAIPFLNLILLLLAFILLLTRFVAQPGFAVSLPTSPFLTPPQQNPMRVNIQATPVPSLFFNDQRMSLEEFGRALAATPPPRRTVVISADRRVPFEFIARAGGECMTRGFPVVLATVSDSP